jgi:transposase
VKNVPGRKTDSSDAAWLAELGAHELLRPSFIPPKDIRELRMLTRYRTKLVATQTAVRNRTIKLLEQSGIKLSSVVCDCFGVTGRAILDALAQSGPINFEACTTAKLRPKIDQLRQCIGVEAFGEKHQQLLRMHLRDYDAVDAQIAVVEKELLDRATPYQAHIARLDAVPGINILGAITLIAETGVEMSVFRSAAHLTVLAGVAPGNAISADKRRRISVRKGNRHLKRILVQIAWAASRKKDSFLRSRFLRQQFRIGRPKAIVALARHILVIVYHVLQGDTYRDFNEHPRSEQAKQRTLRNLVCRIEALGVKVQITPESA